jgi:8-oxo-dGTP pyrophosphatase MutT (NUDIX family)
VGWKTLFHLDCNVACHWSLLLQWCIITFYLTSQKGKMTSTDCFRWKGQKWCDEGYVNGRWGTAGSGFLFHAKGRILFLQRSPNLHYGGRWGLVGGAIPVNRHGTKMPALVSAKREAQEEIGFLPPHEIQLRYSMAEDEFVFTTFIAQTVPFTPKLNWEHTAFVWGGGRWIKRHWSRLHPGVQQLLLMEPVQHLTRIYP